MTSSSADKFERDLTLSAIRKDFWEFLISRHPIEEEHAPSTKRAYRWREIPALHLIVGQYVNARGVGVYVRGEKGVKPDDVEQRLRPYAARLKKALGVEDFITVGKYFLLKFNRCNSSSTANWGKMADWLHKEADVYQKTLYQVVEGRRP
jgi:hypothetical protein